MFYLDFHVIGKQATAGSGRFYRFVKKHALSVFPTRLGLAAALFRTIDRWERLTMNFGYYNVFIPHQVCGDIEVHECKASKVMFTSFWVHSGLQVFLS